MEFEAAVEQDERGHVRLRMPFDPNAEWGTRSRHYVRGTLNGVEFEGTLGSRGSGAFFPLNKALRDRISVAPGDTVRVRVEPTEAPETAVPDDLSGAIAADPVAADFFGGLSGFYQRQYVGWVIGAKKPETRAARIEEVVGLLRAGRRQR